MAACCRAVVATWLSAMGGKTRLRIGTLMRKRGARSSIHVLRDTQNWCPYANTGQVALIFVQLRAHTADLGSEFRSGVRGDPPDHPLKARARRWPPPAAAREASLAMVATVVPRPVVQPRGAPHDAADGEDADGAHSRGERPRGLRKSARATFCRARGRLWEGCW